MNREVVPACGTTKGSSQPRTAVCSGHCEQVHCGGEADRIWLATTLVSEQSKRHRISVDLLIDRLVLWQELTVDDASHIEECDRYDFYFFGFDCLAFFGPGDVRLFH